VTLPARTRALASAAVAALLLGLLSGITTPTGAVTGAPSAQATHRGPFDSVRVPHAFFGLHDGSGQGYQLDYGSLRLWDVHVTWRDIETSPGVYDWSHLDALVSAAQAHHVDVTLVVGMTPSFYASSPTLPPSNLSAYIRFLTKVMARYRDFQGQRGIAAYQVWNEGNISAFWTGTPAQLARLTATVYQIRNVTDPGAEVVAPSFAVRLPYQREWMRSYQRQLVDGKPVWDYYDVNALSLYPKPTYGGHPGGPEDAMRLLGHARTQLHRIGVPGSKKIWATEINYGVTGGGLADSAATPISGGRQVANVLRTYLLGAAHGLARVFWYRYDWGRVASDGGTLGNTLLSDPGDYALARPAGLALRTAQRWLSGKLVAVHGHRPCARDDRGTYRCRVRYDGTSRTIIWNPHRHVNVRVPRRSSARVLGRTAAPRTARHLVRVGFKPVVVTRR
jgi:polysaccharide biosynthesis protein PslG